MVSLKAFVDRMMNPDLDPPGNSDTSSMNETKSSMMCVVCCCVWGCNFDVSVVVIVVVVVVAVAAVFLRRVHLRLPFHLQHP